MQLNRRHLNLLGLTVPKDYHQNHRDRRRPHQWLSKERQMMMMSQWNH
jgi:hypothetical protein